MPALARRLAGFVLALGLVLAGGWPATASPPTWLVQSKTASIVLFGSVHLLPPGLDWEPPALRRALAEADELWFEIPMDPASSLEASRAALAAGLQPPGHPLSADLDAADEARLAHAAKICGLPAEGFERLKPWLADVTLSVASYRLAGAMQESGVERRLSDEAPPALKREAFETPAEQIGYLAGAPIPDQVASLRETFDEIDQGPAAFQRLVDAWMAGDGPAIAREAIEPIRRTAPAVYRALVVERNRRWVERLSMRLQGAGEAVVVVGVGHLVGPDSVPAMLRARGLTVTRIDGPRQAASALTGKARRRIRAHS